MDVQLKKGVLELCVLAYLEKKECYGYELVFEISKNIEISEGTIYPLLKRLKDEGYVMTYILESSEGPSRKYYKLTDSGKKRTAQLKSEWTEFATQVSRVLNKHNSNDKSNSSNKKGEKKNNSKHNKNNRHKNQGGAD
jgi:PadR family transcriptional regulator PadR